MPTTIYPINVLIMEGPAGSGKTTLLRKWSRAASWISPVSREFPGISFHRERSYPGFSGSYKAMAKDHLAIQNLALDWFSTCQTGMLPDPETIWTIDRLAVSNWVYTSIRENTIEHSLVEMLHLVCEKFPRVFWEFSQRCGFPHSDVMFAFTILIAFFIPEREVIYERRARSGKTYPYTVEEERHAYLRAQRYIQRDFPLGQTLEAFHGEFNVLVTSPIQEEYTGLLSNIHRYAFNWPSQGHPDD